MSQVVKNIILITKLFQLNKPIDKPLTTKLVFFFCVCFVTVSFPQKKKKKRVEFEKKRNRPERYDRNVTEDTLKAIKKIDKIRSSKDATRQGLSRLARLEETRDDWSQVNPPELLAGEDHEAKADLLLPQLLYFLKLKHDTETKKPAEEVGLLMLSTMC
ncbi:hypothetical protein YC2023_045739 [Brassica napus]